MTKSRGLLTAVLAALVLMTVAALARAPTPTASAGSPTARASVACQGATVAGDPWNVRQAHTNCAFARYAVQLAAEKRRSPKNWRCYVRLNREFSPDGVPTRVRCFRGEKAVLGLVG